ncbi:MAG: hypothetical protein WCV90_06295 [Candidatus Woesearchaeota archaeon]|jgi:predicted ATP-dependent protease
MQLTKDLTEKILSIYVGSETLKNYPEIEIYVVKEHDYFDHSSCVHGTYFQRKQAEEDCPNLTAPLLFGSMTSYTLHHFTIEDILRGKPGHISEFNAGMVLLDFRSSLRKYLQWMDRKNLQEKENQSEKHTLY